MIAIADEHLWVPIILKIVTSKNINEFWCQIGDHISKFSDYADKGKMLKRLAGDHDALWPIPQQMDQKLRLYDYDYFPRGARRMV